MSSNFLAWFSHFSDSYSAFLKRLVTNLHIDEDVFVLRQQIILNAYASHHWKKARMYTRINESWVFTDRLGVIAGLGQLVVGKAQFVRRGGAVHEHHANVAGGLVQAGVLQFLLAGEQLQAFPHVCKVRRVSARVSCGTAESRDLRLTDLLGHLLHDVGGDVGDGGVAQTLEVLEADFTVQLHRADAAVINVGVQDADKNQEGQEQQREDQLLRNKLGQINTLAV